MSVSWGQYTGSVVFVKYSTCRYTLPMVFTRPPLETIDGIPVFTQDLYWGRAGQGKGSTAEFEQALTCIDTEGWEVFAARYTKGFDFSFAEHFADWRFAIPLDARSVVLDIGAGMGRSTIPLARVAKRVVAFDKSVLRARFIKRRVASEGLTNVDVFVGDLFDLPLPEHSFDVIAMNGILEWVGLNTSFANPRDAQVAALKICAKLLRPGGYLYVGIENRWALAYLRGKDHSGIRYTSYMPRILADAYCRLRWVGSYRTYTYGYQGYKKLFAEAFPSLETYLLFPGYNDPRTLIPYNDLRALRWYLTTLSSPRRARVYRMLCAIPGALYFFRFSAFSFGLYARTPSDV